MHGSKDRGLEISAENEYVSWAELSAILRELNVLLRNNLCVISTACHAFNMISEIAITEPSPYYCLIASQEKVSFGHIDDNTSKFYRTLFSSRSLDEAYNQVRDLFEYYHCEKMLVICLAKYVIRGCKGKQKDQRREDLLSYAINSGLSDSPGSLKELRRMIREHITPDQDLLTKYISQFLVGKAMSITIEDILDLVETSYA